MVSNKSGTLHLRIIKRTFLSCYQGRRKKVYKSCKYIMFHIILFKIYLNTKKKQQHLLNLLFISYDNYGFFEKK